MNLEAFDRDGIVFPAGSIDATGFADRYRAFQAASNRSRGKDTNIKPHLVSPWLWEVVHAPAIVDAVEQALALGVVGVRFGPIGGGADDKDV